MNRTVLGSVLAVIAGGLVVLAAQAPAAPPQTFATTLAFTTQNPAELRDWDGRVDALERSGALALRTVRADTLLPDRMHQRYDQYVGGVRVFGGDISRQTRQGMTESVFGTVYERIAVSGTPGLSEDDARVRFAALSTAELPHDRPVELVVLPRDEGGATLAWRAHVWSGHQWLHSFIDATSGAMVLQYDDLQRQATVGTATGVLGDRKKISANAGGGRYWADDQLRPPVLITYDLRGNVYRAIDLLNGWPAVGSDIASDPDNVWTDGASVDAHVYLGWTYDYFYKRFQRKGLDDTNAPLRAITHPVRRSDAYSSSSDLLNAFFAQAFWCGIPCGPDGKGMMVFGEGLPAGFLPGVTIDYLAGALDVVAHELTHGLTDYTSGLVYANESGALNESFSDVIGTSVEFYFQTAGSGLLNADYVIAEDVWRPGGVRSMADPQAFGDPDHYSRRNRTSADNGGVHTNSGIPNQAFYLAIEGGVNRTSGLHVTGVGAANREQIEQAFYRAFTSMLTSQATFSMARSATVQSARQLYGSGSSAERALTEAWTAVGVN
jgi:bacillolysin